MDIRWGVRVCRGRIEDAHPLWPSDRPADATESPLRMVSSRSKGLCHFSLLSYPPPGGQCPGLWGQRSAHIPGPSRFLPGPTQAKPVQPPGCIWTCESGEASSAFLRSRPQVLGNGASPAQFQNGHSFTTGASGNW